MALPSNVEFPYTVADLEALPDDGHRYELIDGALVVSPGPSWPHQSVVVELTSLLHGVCPRDLRVLTAPFDVRPDEFNSYQPDVLVARYADLDEKYLRAAPVLAVEVLSPSSGIRDATLKKAVYERLGVDSYWLVRPDRNEPALTAFELDGSEYRQVAHVVGGEAFASQRPFPVRVVPAQLVVGLRP
jgi:Uma2 family endonuclease